MTTVALPPPLPVAVPDSHCHLDLTRDGRPSNPDLALKDAAAVGVDRVVHVGCDVHGARWAVELAGRGPGVVAAVALHPNEAALLRARGGWRDAFAVIEELATDPLVRAIGETGLDHARTAEDGWAAQEESFRQHIRLATRLGKALMIHDRDAHDDVLRVLEAEDRTGPVVMHCFSGDAEFAKRCVERGIILSFAGTVTFKNAARLRDALRLVPADQLLVETDAPFLTPAPYRGHENAPALLPYTLAAMAKERGEPLHELAAAVSATAVRVFGEWERLPGTAR